MKPKKLLRTVVTSALVLTGGVLVACDNPEEARREPGPESGVYYNYDGSSTRSLSLSDGDQAALQVDGASMNGTYTVDGTTLRFNLSDVGELAGTLENDTVTLTYNSQQLKFWKDIDYTVTYETFGGSAVAQSNVKYGQVLTAPTAPTRGNDAFLGWTTVAHGETLYSFTEHIDGSLTLYAKWVEATDNEYVISYDLGYEGAAAVPSALTAAGRAYNLPTPTRSGYTFKGWWVSQYHSADKLSYRCNEGVTEFGADTTLFAKWQADGESNPDITVTSSGISWERTGSEVRVIVRGPEGYGNNGVTDNRYGATGATSESVDFTRAPAGDYVITLETGGNSYNVYYKNKAVNDVSRMRVVNNNQLEYSAVSGAEKYYVTVDCGTPGHDHVMIDNGTNTTYNFSACDMKPEGITLTVYAAANGKATSAGRTLNHEAHLAAVSAQSYALNAETGELSWSAVEHATSYAVSVNGGAAQEVTATNFKINNYDGEVSVSVVPKGHGYNPGEAAVYSYTRTTLSTPKNLHIEGSTLKWTGATGASGYEIRVGNVKLTSTVPEIDLNAANIEWQENQEYDISVRSVGANGANASYWSDQTSAAYNTATSPTPRYSASTLTWAYAIGVDHYEVCINDGEIVTVADNYLNNIEFTKRGLNVIRFRSVTSAGPNEWKELQVMAYELSFQLNGELLGSYYKATGDKVTLPDLPLTGYDFSGWRTASINGAAYNQDTYTATTNLTLHASYTPHVYTVKLNYGSYGAAPDGQTTTTVAFDSNSFTLPVPEITDGRMQFIGWNAAANGSGTGYADHKGNAIMAWNVSLEDYTVYAVYAEALTFVEDADGYMVSAGREIDKVKDLVIPATYKGKKVRALNENAFKNCTSLETVSIPSTVRAIPLTAFDGCSIKQYKTPDASSVPDAKFVATEDGSLLQNNDMTGSVDLYFVPVITDDTFRVPGGVTYLRSNVFKGMSVSKIVIPSSVNDIAIGAFVNCTNLTKVEFEEGTGEALTIDPSAFSGCANIEELVLPGRLSTWGENGDVASILTNFAKLKKITVVGVNNNSTYSSDANGILFSGDGATLLFCPRASELTTYVVPSTVLYIGDGAFASVEVVKNGQHTWDSRKLTTVTFHNQMRGIGEKAFYRSTQLNTVTFAAAATPGEGIAIGDQAFYGCSGITALNFNETGALNASNVYDPTTTCSVVSIGESAFSGIRAGEVVLPSTLATIGDSAFSANTSLTTLDLSHVNAQLKFGDSAFRGNSSLTSIDITANVGVIAFQSVFRGCNITEFDVSNNPRYAVDSGVIYNSDFTQLVYVPTSVNLSTYNIKDTVTALAGGIFSGRDDLTRFVVPAAVTTIGKEAFLDCIGLTEIIFTSGTADLEIGAGAFKGCSGLTEITIPGRTTTIGNGIFEGSGIQTVTFAEGVTKIPDRTFYNVKSLKTVTIASTVTEIGEYAFYGSGVSTVTFTNADVNPSGTGKVIKKHAFASCASLVSIVLPEGLNYISESTFEDCAALKYVTIPTTVANANAQAGIGKSAFYNCKQLETITFTDSDHVYESDEECKNNISFGEYSLYNTLSLHVIDLPTRAAPFTDGGYDVFELSSKSGITDQVGVFQSRNTFDQNASGFQSLTMGGELSNQGKYFALSDSILYKTDFSMLVLCPEFYEGKTSTVSGKEHTVTISKYASEIRAGAFKNCKLIYNIEFEAANDLEDENGDALPEFSIPSVGSMNDVVFYGCTNLESIAFPKRLKTLGNYALYKQVSDNKRPAIKSISFADGCLLETIGDNAFTSAPIESLVLPGTVKTIGKLAFAYSGLKSITLSADLEEIGARAFFNTKLTSIDFSRCPNLKSIGAGAFTWSYASNATLGGSVDLPDKFTYLGEGAFRYAKITSATVPSCLDKDLLTDDTTTTESSKIKGAPFDGCSNLQTLTFGSGIKLNSLKAILGGIPAAAHVAPSDEEGSYIVENGLIYEKSEQTVEQVEYNVLKLVYCPLGYTSDNFVIGANVVEIGENAFEDVTGIKKITFADPAPGAPAFDLVICDDAFKGLNITDIVLPARLNSMGANVFQNCSLLTSVSIPAKLTALGDHTFDGCVKLKTISFVGGNSNLGKIGDYAFNNCREFTGTSENGLVFYEKNLTEIGNYAFRNCQALTGVTSKGIQKIGAYAFYGCSELAEYILGDALQTVGEKAFYQCRKLRFIGSIAAIGGKKEFGLSSTIQEIGTSAFQDCVLLGECVGSAGNYTKTDESIIRDDSDKLKKIYISAFENCKSLVTVYIPNSIEVAASTSGLGACGLGCYIYTDTQAYTGAQVTSGGRVFYGCTSLEKVEFQDGGDLNIIGKEMFSGCEKLKEVNIPNSVLLIGISAFEGCGKSLGADETLKVTIDAENSHLLAMSPYAFMGSAIGEITLPKTFKSFGSISSTGGGVSKTTDSYVFQGCTKLTKVTLTAAEENSGVVIGQHTFDGCTSLSDVQLNADITNIFEGAFKNCTSLTEIEVTVNTISTEKPGSVTINIPSIYTGAFKGCENLTTVTINGTAVKTIGEDAFADTGLTTINVLGTGEVAFNNKALNKTSNVTIQIQEDTPCTIAGGAFLGSTGLGLSFGTFSNNAQGTLVYTKNDEKSPKGAYYVDNMTVDGTAGKTLVAYFGSEDSYVVDYDTINIASNAFKNDTVLKTIYIPKDLKKVGSNAFEDSAIETVVFGWAANASDRASTETAGTTKICSEAFLNAKKLVSLNLAGVNTIAANAFQGAGRLHAEGGKLIIPGCVTSMTSASIFEGSAIEELELNPKFSSQPGASSAYSWFKDCQSLTKVKIGANWNNLKLVEQMFMGCTSLTTVDMSEATVTSIGNATGATTAIAGGVFMGCTSLEAISLPDSVTILAPRAFAGCTKLKHVNLNKVTTIYGGAFSGCPADIEITRDNKVTTATYQIQIFKNDAEKQIGMAILNTAGTELLCQTSDENGVVNVPDTVTTINGNAFYNDTTLKEINLPDHALTIDGFAFYGCKNLEKFNGSDKGVLEVNNTITWKNNGHFIGCENITTVNINIANIPNSMFANCTNLTSLTIGNAVTKIVASAFAGCENITGNVVMRNVTSIGAYAFKDSVNAHFYFDGSKAGTGSTKKVGDTNKCAFPVTDDGVIRVHIVNQTVFKTQMYMLNASNAEINASWPAE